MPHLAREKYPHDDLQAPSLIGYFFLFFFLTAFLCVSGGGCFDNDDNDDCDLNKMANTLF